MRVVDGEIEDTFEALVCPAVAIEPETTAIHGITNDDVRRALCPRGVGPVFRLGG